MFFNKLPMIVYDLVMKKLKHLQERQRVLNVEIGLVEDSRRTLCDELNKVEDGIAVLLPFILENNLTGQQARVPEPGSIA